MAIDALAAQAAAGGASRVEQLALTFGVNWPHLSAQIVSFGIVCALLYLLAYKPILRMLESRRQQIADGLAHAEQIRARLAEIEAERLAILRRADEQAAQALAEARAAALRVRAAETENATVAAQEILRRAHEAAARERARMLADARRELGRLVVQTTASVTGKVLTADDHRRLAEEATLLLAV